MADLSQDRVVSNNQKLYNNLLKSGKVTQDEIGDFNTFNTLLSDSSNASKLRDNLISKKNFSEAELGSHDDFLQNLDPLKLESTGTPPEAAQQEQPLTYMQKELRQKFPENYTNEPQSERATSYVPKVVENGKALVGSIPATNPDLSAKHPEYFAPKISDSYQSQKPTVIPQGTGNQFQAIDQTQLENEVGGAQIVQDKEPVKEENGIWSTWVGDAAQGFAGTTMDIVGNMGAMSNLPMRSYLNYKAKGAGIGDEERKIFVDTFLETNPATSANENLKISAKAEAEKLQAKSDRYNGEDFTEQWKQGNYGAVAGDIFLQGVKSLPYMIMAMGGGIGGLTAIGTTSAAGKYEELDNPELPEIYTAKQKADYISQMNMSEFQKLTNSALSGTSEAASELLGSVPMGKYIGRLVAKAGKPAAQEILQKGVSGWMNKMFDRYGLLLGPVMEGVEEVANSLVTDAVDFATGATTELNTGEMVSKAAKSFVYGVGGGAYGSIGAGAVIAYDKMARNAQPITTATIEGQQFTVNNPKDLGIEGKPIFAKDAEGNIIPISGKKKDLITDVVTQTQGELDQAQQAAADQQALMNGIADPNAQVINEVNEDGIRLVKFSNGQSKIITPEGEAIANDQNEEDRILESVINGQPLPQPKVNEVGEVIEPAPERKVVSQTFGNTQIDIIENEDHDEIVPSDKMPLEKALPILEKKFKDNKKFKVVTEKSQIEEPGETKYDDPVKKTVIKSIRIVPVEVLEKQKAEAERLSTEQKQADTNILLEFIDEFNATSQSREDKQQAGEIESIAKKLGYQVDRTPMNEIRLFDNSGTISKPKVSEKSNSENANQEIISNGSDQVIDNQSKIVNLESESSQKSQLQNEESEKSLPNVEGKSITNEGENTPQAQQGQGNKEGLEENVNKNTISTDQSVVESLTADPVADDTDVTSKEIAQQEVNLNPSEAQKESGNYKKAHIKVQGMDITVENPKGSVRKGVDEDGKAWENVLQSHYGYFKRTEGKDGDHIDVFVGENPESQTVYVIDQVFDRGSKSGLFDESKVMIGYNSPKEAADAYMANYAPNFNGLSDLTPVYVEDFKKWLYDGAKQKKPFADYKSTPDPVVKENLSTKNTAKKPNTITSKAKEVEVDPSDIQGLALQYFINGGTVHPDEILRMHRDSKTERDLRKSYADQEGLTVAQIAHNIWEALPENIQNGLTEMGVYNEVESVIQGYNTPTLMAQALLKKYSLDPNQGYSKEWLDAQIKKEDEERLAEIEVWNDYLSELEINGQLPTENELIELFLPENTDNGNQEINQRGSIESDRPANPEGNDQIGQNLQGSEPGVQGENEGENDSEVEVKEPWQMTADEFLKRNNDIERGFQKQRAKIIDDAQALIYDKNPKAFRALSRDQIIHSIKTGTEDFMPFKEQWDKVQQEQDAFFGNDYENIDHKKVIQKALSEGKQVPQEVLNDYPELQVKKPLSEVLSDGKKAVGEKKQSTPLPEEKQNNVRFRVEEQSQIIQDALKYSDVNDFIDAYKDADFRDSHSAPGNSGSDLTIEERMDQGDDFNLTEVVQGFSRQPSDYFDPRNGAIWYGYDDKEGMQSYYAIKSVMSDVNGQIERNGKITKMPKIKAYRAVPKGVEVNYLIDDDWITFSKEYAKGHGENRFGQGEYKIISQNIPANEVWWDGNDINEWGYDTGKTEKLGRSDLKAIWENAHTANRFRIIGEKGASSIDREEEVTTRLDNLEVARQMGKGQVDTYFVEKSYSHDSNPTKGDFYLRFTEDPQSDVVHKYSRWYDDGLEESEYEQQGYLKDDNGYYKNHTGLSGHHLEAETLEDAIKDVESKKNVFKDVNKDSWSIFEANYDVPTKEDTPEGNTFYPEKVLFERKLKSFTPKQIRLATGWEKGVDGKWRYEVPDNIKPKRYVDKAKFAQAKAAYEKIRELNEAKDYDTDRERLIKTLEEFYKSVGVQYYTGDQNLHRMLRTALLENKPELLPEPAISHNIEFWQKKRVDGEALLEDVIDNEQMYAEYPFLRYVGISFKNIDSKGSYSPGSETIVISDKLKGYDEEVKSTMLHEIQHAIQYFEGFAKGGNLQSGIAELYDRINKQLNDLAREMNNLTVPGNYGKFSDPKGYELKEKYDALMQEKLNANPYDYYKRLAGEVESRNVQTRMNMTPEERRNALLSETEDVAREDQIVLMDGLGVSSLQEPTKGSNVNTTSTASTDLKSRPNVVNALTKISDELGEPVYIINSSEIPEKVSELKKQIKDGDRVPAFFYNGKIYLLSDQVTSVSDALKSYLHELIVHKGLREVFAGADKASIIGKQYGKFNDLMIDVFGSMSRSQKIETAAKYVPDLYNQNGKIMRNPTMEEKALIGEEFMAHVSENQEIYDEPTLSRWQQFINRLWQIVRKAFRLTSNQFSQSDLLDIVRESRERLKDKANGTTEAENTGSQLRVSPETYKVSDNGFYSPTEKALYAIEQNKGSVEQFKAMLLKNGAKQAEMDWMGFDEAFPDGKKSVTKGDIQNWIDQNKIEIQEVTKGKVEPKEDPNIAIWEEWANKKYPDAKDIMVSPVIHSATQINYDVIVDGKLVVNGGAQVEKHYLQKNDDTKFSQYSEPGGQNYKELLLTMPIKYRELSLEEFAAKMKKPVSEVEDAYKLHQQTGGYKDYAPGYENQFKSGHYDEPNILAHIRFNERTGENGERVLFVEEIQSDWAQKGKKEGFKQSKEYYQKLESERQAKRDEYDQLPPEKMFGEEGQKLQSEIDQLNIDIQGRSMASVPSMPFSKTEQWVNLAFRRIMLYASENGFDRIAWTNGEMQNERYDLSKSIESIDYGSDGSLVAYDKTGSVVMAKTVPENQLEDNIGKDATEKLLSQEPDNIGQRRLSNQDLKLGGTGMKSFYDAIIPSAANKLGKAFGARVENIELNIKGSKINEKNFTDLKESLLFEKELTSKGYFPVSTIEADGTYTIEWKASEVQSLPVTESMKRSAQEGMSLFRVTDEKNPTINIDGIERSTLNSNGKPIANSEEGIRNFYKWFGDSKVVDSEGRPLVVYHGTNKEFSDFIPSSRGIWLTPDKKRAEGYAMAKNNGEKGITMPLYAKIENISDYETNDEYVPYDKLGYDGWGSKKQNGEYFTIVVKSPSQIKSTGNNGSFSPESNDIRFRVEQAVEDLNKINSLPKSNLSDLLKSVNETVEAGMTENHGIQKKSFLKWLMEKLTEIKESGQHFKHITEAEFPVVYDKLRQFEAIPDRVKKEAYERIGEILRPIIKNEDHYKAFERYIVLQDLVHDVEQTNLFKNKELPWGYETIDEIKTDMRNVRTYVMRNPDVLKAIRDRQKMMKEVKVSLVANKLLKDKDGDTYFHHQVMKFMDERANVGVSSKDVRNNKKGWQRSRVGSIQAYNTNYIESEFEVLAQSLEQVAIKNILGELGAKTNIMPDLIKQAKQMGGSWRDYVPEGYKQWFPKEGTNAYKAASMAEKAVQNILNDPNSPDVAQFIAEVESNMWVIPEPVAKQLDSMKDPEKEIWLPALLRFTTGKWKQWILLNPYSAIKYNFNNMSGDIDIVMAYDPTILKPKYAKTATTEAWNNLRGKGMSEDMKEALQYGIITSGLSIQEIPDVNQQTLFKSVTKGSGNIAQKLWGATGGKYWGSVTDMSQFRENVLRLAAYKFFKEQIEAGKKPLGASNKKAIDALYRADTNSKEVAAKLARELLGDYGNLSQAGQWFRSHSYPFWSWVEINSPRYYRLLKNTKFEDNTGTLGRVAAVGAKKTAVNVGKLGIKAMLLMGLVVLWNRAMFPDEDDELSKQKDQKLKLIIGRREDGSIMTMKVQGAFSDVLSFFSLEDVASDIESEKTAGKMAAEGGTALLNKFAQGAMPLTKTGAEMITKKSFYPDILNPRPVRDRAEQGLRIFKMDKIYNYLTHKPARPFGKEVSGLLVYDNSPGEAAYYTMRQNIFDFMKDNGEEFPSGEPTNRSNALYYYKQSLKFGDPEKASFWFEKYKELGGNLKGYNASMKKGMIINTVPNDLKAAWYQSLDAEDKEVLDMANKWYFETYLKVGIPKKGAK